MRRGRIQMKNLLRSKMNQYEYSDWVRYFEENDRHRLSVDFSEESLTPEEASLIFVSVRAFQRGEGSDGMHLMAEVESYAEKTDDPDFVEAMAWFIKEENYHSAYLREYMDFHGVHPIRKNFLDRIFRTLRQLGGLKCEITVLVTAEMVALTYYDALSNCTGSKALKSICAQMLHDELRHIIFQSYNLRSIGVKHSDRFVRNVIMDAALLAVWAAFRDVYRAGGYRFFKYLKENYGYLRQSVRMVEGEFRESS